MSVEFIEKVHDGISVEGSCGDHDVFLVLCAVAAVGAALLLALQPREGQLLKLKETRMEERSGHERGLLLCLGGNSHSLLADQGLGPLLF